MNERDLDYFAAVAKHGHLGRAAESLGLSQPALSTSLRRLEKSMQAKLVKRTPKGVELTMMGSALLGHLGRLRLAREDVAREVTDLAQGHAGNLRIAVQPGISEELTAAAAAVLLKDAPKVTLQVNALSFDLMVPGLLNGEFDLIVGGTVSPASSGDLTQEDLLHEKNVIYASATHRLAAHKRVTLADLAEERWVKTASAGRSWKALCRTCEEAGLPPPRDVLETNSSAVRSRAVAFGGLLALGNSRQVRQYAQRLPVVVLRVVGFSASRDVVVAHRRDGYLSPIARRVIGILKATAREMSREA